ASNRRRLGDALARISRGLGDTGGAVPGDSGGPVTRSVARSYPRWPPADKPERPHPEGSKRFVPRRDEAPSHAPTSRPPLRGPARPPPGRRRHTEARRQPPDLPRRQRPLLRRPELPQADDPPVGRRAGGRGGGRARDRRHARPGAVRGVPPPDPRP